MIYEMKGAPQKNLWRSYDEEAPFIITLYFTDAIKRGEVLWTRK